MNERLRGTQKYRGGVWRPAPITFASARNRCIPAALSLSLALILAGGLSGCAPAGRPVATTAESPAGPAYATVAAVRPVDLRGLTTGSAPEAAILAAMGAAAPGASPAGGGGAAAEVVVQTDDGQTLSVVEANAAGLVPGMRVIILPGGVPRLVRPGAALPAS